MNQEQLIIANSMAEELGVSTRTLRHFCDSGYIPHIKRNHKYQRILTQEQFKLLTILVRMRQTGFSKAEIKRYAKLARLGKATEPERLAILTTKKHQLQQEIKDRQTAIDFIERQEEIYQDNIDNNTNKC